MLHTAAAQPISDPGVIGQGSEHLTTVTVEAVVQPTSRRAQLSCFAVLDVSRLTHQLPSVIVTRSGRVRPAFGGKWARKRALVSRAAGVKPCAARYPRASRVRCDSSSRVSRVLRRVRFLRLSRWENSVPRSWRIQ